MTGKDSSLPSFPITSRTLWKIVTIVGAIVGATFWIIEKMDQRVKEQTAKLKTKPSTLCHDEHEMILRKIELVRDDLDSIFDEQIRRGQRRNPHVSNRPN